MTTENRTRRLAGLVLRAKVRRARTRIERLRWALARYLRLRRDRSA